MTLHASVHGADGAERQMLFESLLCLGPDDVLILIGAIRRLGWWRI
ncbi:MAG: hypothetical protein IPN53_22995 [Comamonadaceae bacterium]|nr:hypothetical protein [Comamonadaceae bacterium]